MEAMTQILLTSILAAGGVAVGKLWGSHGKQSIKNCTAVREACVEIIEVKLDNIIERLKRIESHVLNGRV
jgi:hypothetical protein